MKVKDIIKVLPKGEWLELHENYISNSYYFGDAMEVPTYIQECEVNEMFCGNAVMVIAYKIEEW